MEELISQLLLLICDPKDPERAFVKFNKNDDVVLLINNYGGLSNLELGALTHETLEQLGKFKSTLCKNRVDTFQDQNGISSPQKYTQGPSRPP